MAAVKYSCKTTAWRQRSNKNTMHLVVCNITCPTKIEWIYHLIAPILLIPIKIIYLTPLNKINFPPTLIQIYMTTIMEKKTIIGSSILDKPSHCIDNISSGWNRPRICLIVCEEDHILCMIPISLSDKL